MFQFQRQLQLQGKKSDGHPPWQQVTDALLFLFLLVLSCLVQLTHNIKPS